MLDSMEKRRFQLIEESKMETTKGTHSGIAGGESLGSGPESAVGLHPVLLLRVE